MDIVYPQKISDKPGAISHIWITYTRAIPFKILTLTTAIHQPFTLLYFVCASYPRLVAIKASMCWNSNFLGPSVTSADKENTFFAYFYVFIWFMPATMPMWPSRCLSWTELPLSITTTLLHIDWYMLPAMYARNFLQNDKMCIIIM